MSLRFRQPTLDDAERLLAWRRDPDITRFMFTDLPEGQTVDDQKGWLTRCAGRDDFHHFVIEHKDKPVGYCNFVMDHDPVHHACATGSYVGEAGARAPLAAVLHSYLMDYAFYALGVHKVVNLFMTGNDKVIEMQRRLKCREVGTLREHVFKNGEYHDVVMFELLERDWRDHPHTVDRKTALAAFEDA